MRVAYHDGSAWTSYSEMMGLPVESLSTKYVFSWYNDVVLDTQMRFGNVGGAPTTVTVTIGGVERGSYDLGVDESMRASYVGVNAGPVVVESSDGVLITASERVAYHDGSAWTSFAEWMGLPAGTPVDLLTDAYIFPWYNNVVLDTQLRFGVP